MANNTKEYGVTGLENYAGIIQQEFLTDLRISGHGKGYKIYDEMRKNSPVVGALLNAISQAILAVDWTFTSENGNEDPRLQLINDSINNMDFTLKEHMTEVLSVLSFGFSLFEIVYQRVGGRLLWRKFSFRGQDTINRWIIDEDKDKGKILGFEQQSNTVYQPVEIPIDKCIHYRTNKERNNPEGISMLRTSYTSYYYAKNITAIEAIGIERDLVGIPMIKLPDGADTSDGSDDMTRAEKIVRRVRNDEQAGLVIPPGWDFTLVSAESTRQTDSGSVISRHEKRILMSVLAQFLVLGMDQVGSMSLSEDQTDFFNMSVNSFADMIADTFTRQAVRKLMVLNGLDPNGVKLEHSPAGDVSMITISEALKNLAGFITLFPEDQKTLRSIIGLPDKTVEEIEAEEERQASREQDIISGVPPVGFDAFEATPEETKDDIEKAFSKKISRFFKKQRERVLDNVAGL